MNTTAQITHRADPLIGLLLLYAAASLLHFAHNAEYLSEYPNLPHWLTRAGIYLAWCAQAAVGILGYLLYRSRRRLIGLALIGAYAAFGFDGLLHYARAPFEAHTAAMNFTIGFEAVTAALLLICVLAAARQQIMFSIQPRKLPQGALLARYLGGGAYADCYVTEIARPVTHAEYVSAFYTTWVFKLERLLLKWLVSRPSTDAQAREFAAGTLDKFAAWNAESRGTDQLLLSDFRGRTRSWLMVEKVEIGGAPGTRLYFGSAVVPAVNPQSGQSTLGLTFRALLGFHKLYSRVLLLAVSRALMHPSASEATRT